MGFKKYKKIIEKALPTLYDYDGEEIDRGDLATRILKAIPNADKLELQPFEPWIPPACSKCEYNEGRFKGCMYDLYSETKHAASPAPDDCPMGY